LPEGPDGADGATQFPSILCHMKIMNPFNFLDPSNKEFMRHTNVVIFGTLYHFQNNYTTTDPARRGIITNFMMQRLHPVKLGRDWRINFKQQTASTTRVTPVRGDGWVYGYYNQAVSENQEFNSVV
jgi:hypothetical protein